MTSFAFLSLVPALLSLFALQPGGVSRLVEDDQTIMRVPVQPRAIVPNLEWVERKGPHCIPARAVRRAFLSGPDKVDFVLFDRTRVRAQFDDRCPALDFYGGFYLRTEDQRLCAERDSVHSRMGGNCTIERFKLLVPRVNR